MFKDLPDVIRAASKDPISLTALFACLIAIIRISLFTNADNTTKIIIFVFVVVCLLFLIRRIGRSTSGADSAAITSNSAQSNSQTNVYGSSISTKRFSDIMDAAKVLYKYDQSVSSLQTFALAVGIIALIITLSNKSTPDGEKLAILLFLGVALAFVYKFVKRVKLSRTKRAIESHKLQNDEIALLMKTLSSQKWRSKSGKEDAFSIISSL